MTHSLEPSCESVEVQIVLNTHWNKSVISSSSVITVFFFNGNMTQGDLLILFNHVHRIFSCKNPKSAGSSGVSNNCNIEVNNAMQISMGVY